MRCCVLGPLEVQVDGRVAVIAGGRQRAVLGLLLVQAGAVVSRDRMIDELWGEGAHAGAPAGLDVCVSRLRRALRDAGAGDALVRRGPGYALTALETDARDFEAQVAAARAALGGDDASGAADVLRDALGLWRGAAYADFADEPWALPEAGRLEDLRLGALEDRIDADLRLARHAELAPEIEMLVTHHPTRERLVGQLMLALYRSGRQADALSVLRQARESMVEQLGLEPGPDLRRLEAAILCQEPALDSPAPPRAPVMAGEPEAERKQVTVLTIGLADPMRLADETSPEALRSAMRRVASVLSSGVQRLGGAVEQLTGEGLVALFGAPTAHEDHARRGCYAALHLQREGAALAAELGPACALRIGLSSGEAVVDAAGLERGVALPTIGRTVALARAIERGTPPGGIGVSAATAELVDGYFTLRDLGPRRLEGAREPVGVHELVSVSGARGAIDAARGRGLSAFVGRDRELLALEEALEQGLASSGHMIGVVGHPGVGKSRLCHEFLERRREDGVAVFRIAGQSHARDVPLLPVLGYLRDVFGIDDGDTPVAARALIEQLLAALPGDYDDDLSLVFDFLAVPDPARPVERMDPEARQRRMLSFMARMGGAYRSQRPTIMLFEDLHWMDPASEAFLAGYARHVQASPGLTLLTFRPVYRAPWMSSTAYAQIALDPLGQPAVDALLDELLGRDASLQPVRALIVDRAQGNPFFVEELVRSLVGTGCLDGARGALRVVRPVDPETVPAGVHAVLAARIDGLAAGPKRLLEAAAVLGREFPLALLHRVAGLEADAFDALLGDLVAGEYLQEHDRDPEPQLAFVHALTRDVAYQTILEERRPDLHANAARAIETHDTERLDERAALVAQHWEAAGEAVAAARWHARAAAWAGATDQPQAIRHWTAVRKLTDALPEREAVDLQLRARIALVTGGWRLGMPKAELAALFGDTERLIDRIGDDALKALLLFGYSATKAMQVGAWDDVAEVYREAEILVDRAGDDHVYLSGAIGGYAFTTIGRLDESIAWYERRVARAAGDPTIGSGPILICPYAFCLIMQSLPRTARGELRVAAELLARGRELARTHGDLEVVGFSHMWAANLAYAEGAGGTAVPHAEQALAIAQRIGGSFSLTMAWFHLGAACLRAGHPGRALEAFGESQALAKHHGLWEHEGWRQALRAEGHLALGEWDEARRLAEDGVRMTRELSHVIESIHADIALARVVIATESDPADAEHALAQATATIAATGALAYEPMVHEERARLADLVGNASRRDDELRRALSGYEAIGAHGHVTRLAGTA